MTKIQKSLIIYSVMENYIEISKIIDLATKWKKDATIYQKQVDEARLKNTPHDQMLSATTFLKSCAAELEKLIK